MALTKLKRAVRKLLNSAGYELTRIERVPEFTLLGIRDLPIKTIIDVGANIGQFARRMAVLFPESSIYCFEPLPGPFSELEKWTERCDTSRVRLFNIGLGDQNESVVMFEHLDHSPSSSILKSTRLKEEIYPFTRRQNSVEVRVERLDDFLERTALSLDPPILIKLDVQGYEDRVIRGGRDTFSRAEACIIEVNLERLYENQATFKEIVTLLDQLGYHFAGTLKQHFSDDRSVVYLDAVFRKR